MSTQPKYRTSQFTSWIVLKKNKNIIMYINILISHLILRTLKDPIAVLQIFFSSDYLKFGPSELFFSILVIPCMCILNLTNCLFFT